MRGKQLGGNEDVFVLSLLNSYIYY